MRIMSPQRPKQVEAREKHGVHLATPRALAMSSTSSVPCSWNTKTQYTPDEDPDDEDDSDADFDKFVSSGKMFLDAPRRRITKKKPFYIEPEVWNRQNQNADLGGG